MAMIHNLGTYDRVIRLIVGTGFLLIAFFTSISDAQAATLGILGSILVITAVVNFCPVYNILGISTLSKRNKA